MSLLKGTAPSHTTLMNNYHTYTRWAIVLLCWGIVFVGAVMLHRHSGNTTAIDIDIGNEGTFIAEGETRQFHSFDGFYTAEMWHQRSVRWMSERGTLTLPAALQLHPHVVVFDACGCQQPTHETTTTLLHLRLNNIPFPPLPTTAQWRRYTLLLPSPAALPHPEQSLFIEWQAPTQYHDGQSFDDRSLSVAFDRIVLRQLHQTSWLQTLQTMPSLLLFSVLIVCIVVAAMMLIWCNPSCTSIGAAACSALFLCIGWLIVYSAYVPNVFSRETTTVLFVVGWLICWGAVQHTQRHMPLQWHALVLTAVTMWLTLSPSYLSYWFTDDAFISFRYARNVVLGNGLVFNVGERVEGYTNFLWTMLIAVGMRVGIEPVIFTALITMVLAYVLVACTMLLTRRLVYDTLPQYHPSADVWAWLSVLPLIVSNSLLMYTTRGSGMETALFATLMVVSLMALVQRAWVWGGIASAGVLLTRPDGALLVACGIVYTSWHRWHRWHRHHTAKQQPPPQWFHPIVHYSLSVAVLFIPYFAWRWHYYGYPLPNTFYIKVSGSWAQVMHGATYLWASMQSDPILPAAIIMMMSSVGVWRVFCARTQIVVAWHAVLLVGSVVVVFGVYVIAAGGDWMPGARFLVPIMPLCAVMIGWSGALLWQQLLPPLPLQPQVTLRVGARVVVPVVLVIVLTVWLATHLAEGTRATWWAQHETRRYREIGAWLATNTPPNTLLAVAAAGAMPYYANRPTVDMLGLNDEHIAHVASPPHENETGLDVPGHQKTDLAYVLQRQPDIIPQRGILEPLRQQASFQRTYTLYTVRGNEGHTIRLYMHNSQ